MVDDRASSNPLRSGKLKSGAGRLITIVVVFFALLTSLLFVSGFWDVRPLHADNLPMAETNARAEQQASPAAVSKDSVAGTMRIPVDLPEARKAHD